MEVVADHQSAIPAKDNSRGGNGERVQMKRKMGQQQQGSSPKCTPPRKQYQSLGAALSKNYVISDSRQIVKNADQVFPLLGAIKLTTSNTPITLEVNDNNELVIYGRETSVVNGEVLVVNGSCISIPKSIISGVSARIIKTWMDVSTCNSTINGEIILPGRYETTNGRITANILPLFAISCSVDNGQVYPQNFGSAKVDGLYFPLQGGNSVIKGSNVELATSNAPITFKYSKSDSLIADSDESDESFDDFD